jgi:hypothetical protein
MVAASDRIIRDACMKGAIRLSRSLKSRGYTRAASRLMNGATRWFPVGARGDFGQKDRPLFGRQPEKLIAEYAAYLRTKGRNTGMAPTNQPPEDSLKARELMNSHRIFDPLSKLTFAVPDWGGVMLVSLLGLACFFAAAGNGKAAGIMGVVFFSVCLAWILCRRLGENFMVWMTVRLFYAASRKLERDRLHGRRDE